MKPGHVVLFNVTGLRATTRLVKSLQQRQKSIFYSPRSVAEVHIEVLWDIVTNFAMTSGLGHELSDFCKGIIKLCGISLEKQEMKRDKLIKKNKNKL